MLKISNKKHITYYSVLILFILIITTILSKYLIDADKYIYDNYIRLRNYRASNNNNIDTNIVIIKVDDKSLLKMDKILGNWPWKRSIHAELINTLKKYNAKSIFFDFLYSERALTTKEQFSRLLIKKHKIKKNIALNLSSQIFADYNNIVIQLINNKNIFAEKNIDINNIISSLNIVYNDNDIVLMNAIKNSGNVFLPYLSLKNKLEVIINNKISEKMNISSIKADSINKIKSWVHGIRIPLYGLIKNTKSLNNVSFINFVNEINRKIPIITYMNNRYYPHMDLALYNFSKNIPLNHFKVINKNNKAFIKIFPDKEVELDSLGRIYVNFRGKTDKFTTLSYYDVVFPPNDSVKNHNKNILKNKTIIIGSTAVILQDLWKTPIGLIPGITYHANVLNTLLKKDFIKVLTSNKTILYSILITIFFAALFFLIDSLLINTIIFITAFLIMPIISYSIFTKYNFFMNLIPFLSSMLITFAAINIFRMILERSEKSIIRHTFEKYVSSNIVKELLKSPESVELGGEKRDMTILFSDIRSFTTFSEMHDPSEIITRLNEFFNAMTSLIYENKGTLDKYVGDEIMALFGAPIHYEEHAYMACLTAVNMINLLKKMRTEWGKTNQSPFDIGVGINSGEVVVGNIGSNYVMDYTVIGDNVNLAARVEAETRNYDAHIIITESTLNKIRDYAGVTYLNDVIVKGKTKPVKIYGLDYIIDKKTNKKIIVQKI